MLKISFVFNKKAKSYDKKKQKNLAVYKHLHATVCLEFWL